MPDALQLRGEVQDPQLLRLQNEIQRLKTELHLSELRREQLEEQNPRSIAQLRRVLAPLYVALQQVFGQMEAIGGEEGLANPSKWDTIKQRYPGRIAQAIECLELHGEMNVTQLANAMKMDRGNCGTNVVRKLAGLGLLVRNGRMFSLKDLP